MPSLTFTWTTAIADAATHLGQADIADAQTNAEYLAMYILGVWKKSELSNYLPKSPTKEQAVLYEEIIARRITNEPLQHIIGETEFFGLRLLASRAALIPRPDTEILVEEVLKEASVLPGKQVQILDIGTGSGAIALAVASKFPEATIIGIDISSDAIILANKNKARLKIENVFFETMDIFRDGKFSASFDLIVSNPPYISASEFETLEPEVRDFDPRIALTDEGDGLSFYRRIAEVAQKLLNDNGRILVEVGYNGILQVEKIFTDAGYSALRRVKDLHGIERVLVIERCAS